MKKIVDELLLLMLKVILLPWLFVATLGAPKDLRVWTKAFRTRKR